MTNSADIERRGEEDKDKKCFTTGTQLEDDAAKKIPIVSHSKTVSIQRHSALISHAWNSGKVLQMQTKVWMWRIIEIKRLLPSRANIQATR